MADQKTDPHDIPGTAEYEHRFSQSSAPRSKPTPDQGHVELVLEAARREALFSAPKPAVAVVSAIPPHWRRSRSKPAATGHLKPARAGKEKD